MKRVKPWILYVTALLLFAAGAGMIAVPHIGPEPEVTCQPANGQTSGFAIEKDGQECPLSPEDFDRIWEWENESAVPLHIAGLITAVVAIGVGITAVVVTVRRRRARKSAAALPGPTGPRV